MRPVPVSIVLTDDTILRARVRLAMTWWWRLRGSRMVEAQDEDDATSRVLVPWHSVAAIVVDKEG